MCNINIESNILTASNDKLTCSRNFCIKLPVSSLKRYRKRSISCWRNQRLRSSLQKKKLKKHFLNISYFFAWKLDRKPSEYNSNTDFAMWLTHWEAWKWRQETFSNAHSMRKDLRRGNTFYLFWIKILSCR